MKIKKLLNCTAARIVLYDKWLVLTANTFYVYQRKPYQKHTRLVYEGKSEEIAIDKLYEEKEE